MTQEESSAVLTSLSNANSLDKSDGEEDDVNGDDAKEKESENIVNIHYY
jgi:hypothetical protein